MIVHAGLIARRSGGFWGGVLIEGASGVGKSTLALQALERGWRFVADDRVCVWTSAGRLYGRAPAALHGLIEARGVGVLPHAALPLAEVVLALAHAETPDRIPDPAHRVLAGVSVPALALNLREPAALARLALALDSDARPHRLDSAAPGRI